MGICHTGKVAGPDCCPEDGQGSHGLTGFTASSVLDRKQIAGKEKGASTSRLHSMPGSVGYSCRKGSKAMPNQDSWTACMDPDSVSMYGVFDGHGSHGHFVSHFVKQDFMSVITDPKCRDSEDGVEQVAKDAFHRIQKKSKRMFGAEHSGTTATIAVHDHLRDRLTVAHVGDSTAVLGQLRGSGEGEEWEAVPLTRDHKPELTDEAARIQTQGGVVRSDGYQLRVYGKGSGQLGLNMTRSIGDIYGHTYCGLSCNPEVYQFDVADKDKLLLICSDGVWDVISHLEAVRMVGAMGPKRAMEAAAKLAEEAQRRWIRATKGAVMDDTTVVAVFLQQDHMMKNLPRSCTIDSAVSTTDSVTAHSDF